MKLGRNDPCWCGSGKKFKKCHLNRQEQNPVPKSDAFKAMKDMKAFKGCMVPVEMQADCERKIINAHTISKSAVLKPLERDGHVYTTLPELAGLDRAGGMIKPRLIGVSKASVFTGFCSHHDKELFKPLDDELFSATFEQLFSLNYRITCKELYLKAGQTPIVDVLKSSDRGGDAIKQLSTQMFADDFKKGTEAAFKELTVHKAALDRMLISKQFDALQALVVRFALPLPIACSSSWCPDYDFDGNMLQDLADLETPLQRLSFHVFSSDGNGYMVFVWTPENGEICTRLMEDLQSIAQDQLSDLLIRFSFSKTENIFMSPVWWEGLEPNKQDAISATAMLGLPFVEEGNAKLSDGLDLGDWGVMSLEKVNW